MENNKESFLNKILFKKQILKIKNKKIKKYFLSLFEMKIIILKLVFFILLSVLIFTSSFGLREYFIKYEPDEIALNSGIAFSQFENAHSTFVYFIQSIPVTIAFFAILLIPNPIICFGIIMLFIGGLINIIDRSLSGTIIINGKILELKDSVIDYIKIGNTKANLPDIFVITGTCITGLTILITIIKSLKNNTNNMI